MSQNKQMHTHTLSHTHCAFVSLFSYLLSNLFHVQQHTHEMQLNFSHICPNVNVCVCVSERVSVGVHCMIIMIMMAAALSSIHNKHERILYQNKWIYEPNCCAHKMCIMCATALTCSQQHERPNKWARKKWMVNMHSKFITTDVNWIEMKTLQWTWVCVCVFGHKSMNPFKVVDYHGTVS